MNNIASNRNFLIIDGKHSYDFNLYISGDGTYLSPEKNVDEVTIPGRNGTLLFEEGESGQSYKNVDVTYKAFIFPDFDQNITKLRSYLLTRQGYFRLEDTYHPDEFRLASFKEDIDPDMHRTLYTGEFDITFNCKPQRYLKIGEETKTFTGTSGNVIFNPTDLVAKPLILAYGVGSFTIAERKVTITGTSSTGTTYIDCDTMNAYSIVGDNIWNRNFAIKLENDKFPVLFSGENAISMTGVTRLEITPRWWNI